jgi:hypothetical protein
MQQQVREPMCGEELDHCLTIDTTGAVNFQALMEKVLQKLETLSQ